MTQVTKSILLQPFTFIFSYRILLYRTVIQDLRARFSGSLFGFTWLILQPILFLSVYALVYIFVFKVKFQLFDTNEYVLVIFCGLIPFLGFSESVSTGLTSVSGNPSLIKNTLYPVTIIPLKCVFLAQATQIISVAFLFILIIFIKGPTILWILFPAMWILQILFLTGLVWILSTLNVYIKDLQYIIGTIILLLMMISPIAYPASMVPSTLKVFFYINPLAHMIICYQNILVIGQFPGIHFIIFGIVSLFMFYCGYFFIERMKSYFIENI